MRTSGGDRPSIVATGLTTTVVFLLNFILVGAKIIANKSKRKKLELMGQKIIVSTCYRSDFYSTSEHHAAIHP